MELRSGKSYPERSERFQFEDFSFDVKVTLISERKIFSYVYMTVAKAAEFEELLSRENVRQLAAQINKPNNTLGITRADFVESYNEALREVEQLKTGEPPGYFNKFIIDNNDVEERDSAQGRVVYFKLSEENINLDGYNITFGCLECEKYLRAIFYKSVLVYKARDVPDSRDLSFQAENAGLIAEAVVRALYRDVHWRKILDHLEEISKFELDAIHAYFDSVRPEFNESIILNTTPVKTSSKAFPFEDAIFFNKTTLGYDMNTGDGIVNSFVTITRDAALENVFDEQIELETSDEGLGITREKFINSYNELVKNNEFKMVEELVDETGKRYFKLRDDNRRAYSTERGKFLERVTYRATDGIGWDEIFHVLVLAVATVLRRTNKEKSFPIQSL